MYIVNNASEYLLMGWASYNWDACFLQKRLNSQSINLSWYLILFSRHFCNMFAFQITSFHVCYVFWVANDIFKLGLSFLLDLLNFQKQIMGIFLFFDFSIARSLVWRQSMFSYLWLTMSVMCILFDWVSLWNFHISTLLWGRN